MQYFRRDISTGETIKAGLPPQKTDKKIKGIVSGNNAFDFYKLYAYHILPIGGYIQYYTKCKIVISNVCERAK